MKRIFINSKAYDIELEQLLYENVLELANINPYAVCEIRYIIYEGGIQRTGRLDFSDIADVVKYMIFTVEKQDLSLCRNEVALNLKEINKCLLVSLNTALYCIRDLLLSTDIDIGSMMMVTENAKHLEEFVNEYRKRIG